ncbi:MAG: nucleotidyltransferase substrate binding protein [Eubacterium sp.]|jgi:nucleotidyltransferase substrate binding protein (TIGR01987 family)|uniref:HI0074 family nucleotidyltransferase substrate-binding subunit n=1 Tax=Eubacterium sp. F2 TaxID=3381348 RepID=UPI003907EDAC|nr:nucleotidyltransferase substrate binding protein [Eubacterium sp.]MCI2197449.1 nucleotidyltransferase substrate binding protein [Eubacterium sp.]
MKKIDNFKRCLDVLSGADFKMAVNDEIYRTGVVGQFNLTFELAWKALKAVLEENGVVEAETGSARDIFKLAAKTGMIADSSVWLLMLKKRNLSVHLYNEEEVDELLILIRDSFLPALHSLEQILTDKEKEIESDSEKL